MGFVEIQGRLGAIVGVTGVKQCSAAHGLHHFPIAAPLGLTFPLIIGYLFTCLKNEEILSSCPVSQSNETFSQKFACDLWKFIG